LISVQKCATIFQRNKNKSLTKKKKKIGLDCGKVLSFVTIKMETLHKVYGRSGSVKEIRY